MEQTLIFKYPDGAKKICPAHKFLEFLEFDEDEMEEAFICQYIAEYAEKKGCSASWARYAAGQVMKVICSPSSALGHLKDSQE